MLRTAIADRAVLRECPLELGIPLAECVASMQRGRSFFGVFPTTGQLNLKEGIELLSRRQKLQCCVFNCL